MQGGAYKAGKKWHFSQVAGEEHFVPSPNKPQTPGISELHPGAPDSSEEISKASCAKHLGRTGFLVP
ncbi:hypothetical protein KIL84_014082 [Mauremys mutica]|uniref:Uncharacterized protein n=1 Tax=Mauremys mutica TaxID=74926 RepID=A0A9D4B7D7_9SAUR|nr:hypothetical protein KIL84_014082 [Mauremys mutica]